MGKKRARDPKPVSSESDDSDDEQMMNVPSPDVEVESAAAGGPSGPKLTQKAVRQQKAEELRNLNRYVNKQRTLVFASRGVTHRDRHFMNDCRDLMPHSKTDAKLDAKDKLFVVNEVCEMKNCNNALFFENRKHKDLYMWVTKSPHGPSAKFLVQNIHTVAEVKLTGNCLKGARPVLCFDQTFGTTPEYRLLKELFVQAFGSPKGHPKVKPFTDHIMSFFVCDNRIWFRNYQIDTTSSKDGEPVLVEIGPRFVLNPVRIFAGSMGGVTLWENPHYVTPNAARSALKLRKSQKFVNRVAAQEARKKHKSENPMPEDVLASTFREAAKGDEDDEDDEDDDDDVRQEPEDGDDDEEDGNDEGDGEDDE